MKNNRKGFLLPAITLIICGLLSVPAYAATPGSVENLRSTSHSLNAYSSTPRITMAWSVPNNVSTSTVYFYSVFNTSSDYTITSDIAWDLDSSTSKTTISEDKSSNNGGYYFHIAAMVEDEEGDELLGGTTTKGPYYIDTKAPTNTSVSAPSTTNNQVVTLSLSADGATEMYISNSGYAMSGSWETYVTSKQWELSDGYGSKTVYVSFRDAAGNATDGTDSDTRATITYQQNTAPQIRDLTTYASGTEYSAPNIYFKLYDYEGGNITLTVSSSNSTATTPENITISGITVAGGKTTYTISTNADEERGLTLTILRASTGITSTVITLQATDSGGASYSDTETVTFSIKEYSITNNLNVEFSNISISSEESEMIIQWQTTTEVDSAGFLLQRSENKNGPFETITDRLIPAQGNAFSGASYSYSDSQIESGKIYYYQLVEVDINNNQAIHSINNDLTRSGDEVDTLIYDANNDGKEDIADVIYLLQILTDFK